MKHKEPALDNCKATSELLDLFLNTWQGCARQRTHSRQSADVLAECRQSLLQLAPPSMMIENAVLADFEPGFCEVLDNERGAERGDDGRDEDFKLDNGHRVIIALRLSTAQA